MNLFEMFHINVVVIDHKKGFSQDEAYLLYEPARDNVKSHNVYNNQHEYCSRFQLKLTNT